MAYIQDRRVTTGELINGTFINLAAIKRPLAMYFGFFFVAGLIGSVSSFLSALAAIPLFVAYFAGQYFLYRAILGSDINVAGLGSDDALKVLGFFLMAVLLSIPLYFSMFFLIVPAILLGAKWVMAPSFLAAEDMNFIEAIGASWRASGGNLVSIALAYTVMWLIWIAFITALSAVGGGFETALNSIAGISRSSLGVAASSIIMHSLPVLLMGLSATAYKSLSDQSESLVAIFE
ncbi:MAG: hypothetical protein AAGL10_01005 [Pseudomonadota bacterium]